MRHITARLLPACRMLVSLLIDAVLYAVLRQSNGRVLLAHVLLVSGEVSAQALRWPGRKSPLTLVSLGR
ncbi:MAG: hypothetical protein KatS3mg060_2128 [Dehalococcoidia bacterium]|jgi:hypothetical protein|nr:MAG: hypothetical protein KatS3mg060_2128 [Dehalococcoidia bacterium]